MRYFNTPVGYAACSKCGRKYVPVFGSNGLPIVIPYLGTRCKICHSYELVGNSECAPFFIKYYEKRTEICDILQLAAKR